MVGVSSGYFGGRFDMVVQRIVEFVKAFPTCRCIWRWWRSCHAAQNR
ncbi:MAG: hypothetical protein R3E89_08775 [Thiolinea sp.]